MIFQRIIDASAAVEYLLKTQLGLAVADTIERSDVLHAPGIIDVEVMSALRRLVGLGELEEHRALLALDDMEQWPIERIPPRELIRHGWRHRHNVSAYDAIYVAAARQLGLPLLTADAHLTRAPGLGIVIENIRQL